MFSRSNYRRALVSVGSRSGGGFHTVSSSSYNTNSAQDDSSNDSPSYDSSSSPSPSYDGVSASEGNQQDQAALHASATQLMRFRISKPEQFYFSGGDSICRLCNEFVPSTGVRFHLVGAGPRGPSTHMGREIVLDSLVYYGKLGYDPALVMRSWAFTLLSHPQYVRLPELLPSDPTDLQARAEKVHELLQSLKALKIIDIAISPHSEPGRTDSQLRAAFKRRVAFERLECIGDNAWGSHLSGRMLLVFPDKRWAHCQMHHSFNTFRDLAETNTNLERMFDLLDIAELLPPASRSVVGDGKIKADIFEAILGELNCALYAHEANLWGSNEEYTELNDEHLSRVCIIIKHVLNEIFDLTLLCLMYLLGEHAIPIARELSLSLMMSNVTPSKPALDVGDTVRTRRPHYHKNYVPTFTLPPPLQVTTSTREKTTTTTTTTTVTATKTPTSRTPASAKSETRNSRSTAIIKKFGPAVNTTPKAVYIPIWEEYLSAEERFILDDEKFLSRPQQRLTQMYLEDEPKKRPAEEQEGDTVALTSCQPPLRTKDEFVSGSSSFGSNVNVGASQQQQNIAIEDLILQKFLDVSPTSSSFASSQRSFRNLCPFTQLSKSPPHTYNPYGLDSATWMSRWKREEEMKEIFDADVCDNIGTVIAQFEATAAFNNSARSAGGTSEARRNYSLLVDQVFERLGRSSGSSDSSGNGAHQDQSHHHHHHRHNHLEFLSIDCFKRLSYVRNEVLGHVHPFKDGVTVGSDGASFGSMSSSVNDVVNRASALFDGSSDSQETESSSSSSTLTGGETIPTAKLDIDEIKRRNALLSGKRF